MATLDSVYKDEQQFKPGQSTSRIYNPRNTARTSRTNKIEGKVKSILGDVGIIVRDQRELSISAVERKAQDSLNKYNVALNVLKQEQDPLLSRKDTMESAGVIYGEGYEEFEDPDYQKAFDRIYTSPAHNALETNITTWSNQEKKLNDTILTRHIETDIDTADFQSYNKDSFSAFVSLKSEEAENTAVGKGRGREVVDDAITTNIRNRMSSDYRNDPSGFMAGMVNKYGVVDTNLAVEKWNSYNKHYGNKTYDSKTGKINTEYFTESSSIKKKLADSWNELSSNIAGASSSAYKTTNDDIMQLVIFSTQANNNNLASDSDMFGRIKAEFPGFEMDKGLQLKVLNMMEKSRMNNMPALADAASSYNPYRFYSEGLTSNPIFKKQIGIKLEDNLKNYMAMSEKKDDDPTKNHVLMGEWRSGLLVATGKGHMDNTWQKLGDDILRTNDLKTFGIYSDFINEPTVRNSMTANMSETDKNILYVKMAVFQSKGVTMDSSIIGDMKFSTVPLEDDVRTEFKTKALTMSPEDEDSAFNTLVTLNKLGDTELAVETAASIGSSYEISEMSEFGTTFSVKKEKDWNSLPKVKGMSADDIQSFIMATARDRFPRTKDRTRFLEGNTVMFKTDKNKPYMYTLMVRDISDIYYTSPRIQIDIREMEKYNTGTRIGDDSWTENIRKTVLRKFTGENY